MGERHVIRIYSHEPELPKVFLDDFEITKFLFGVDVSLVAGHLPEVTLHLHRSVEIEGDVEALLKIERPGSE